MAATSSNQEQQLRAQVELLKNHEADASAGSGASDTHASRSPPPPEPQESRSLSEHEAIAAASQDVARALASRSDADSHIHPDLRARSELSPHDADNDTMMSMAPPPPPSGHSPEQPSAPDPSSNPALAPAPRYISPHADDGEGDEKKYKRELSQTKRAAQNRAAQRAFRQRKETHIKKLEQQVREYAELEQSFKSLQSENYALREYVLHLQARMMDTMGEVPQPPPNVNLSQQGSAPSPTAAPAPAPVAQEGGSEEHAHAHAHAHEHAHAHDHAHSVGTTPLEAVAQAVAGLAAQDQWAERQEGFSNAHRDDDGHDDAPTADEINRHLHTDEHEG